MARKADNVTSVAAAMKRAPTSVEAAIWERLHAGRLFGLHFRRQQIIERFIVDFNCHKGTLAIELDGAVHNDTQSYDAERDAMITSHGIKVLRFTNNDIEVNIEGVLRVIAESAYGRVAANGNVK